MTISSNEHSTFTLHPRQIYGQTMSSQHRPLARWCVYTLLLILRFLGVFQRGYVHPDEFFQGGQELFFGRHQRYEHFHQDRPHGGGGGRDYLVNNVPWEFEPRNALRSIVPPAFMTLLPLRMYVMVRHWIRLSAHHVIAKEAGEELDSIQQQQRLDPPILWSPELANLTGKEILLLPRLFMALLSVLFFDGSLWILVSQSCFIKRISHQGTNNKSASKYREESITWRLTTLAREAYRLGPPIEVIALASSWPCLTFGMRPFTNSLEAMVLAFLLVIVAMNATHSTNATGKELVLRDALPLLLIGATCSVGIFVRFTFVFFAFPIVAYFLWNRWKSIDWKLKCIIQDGSFLAFGFLLISSAFIWVDTQYYSLQSNLDCEGTSCAEISETKMASILQYIAPMNAFLYNSKSTNLAEHGIHPLITHAAVNMPMLFGPLALVWYGSMVKNIYGVIARKNNELSVDTRYSFTKTACQGAILSGLLVLSCAPHQEPRFLLPSIVPIVFLFGQSVVGCVESENGIMKWSKVGTSLLLFWCVFNLVLYIFFGWLHQGGLASSLLHLEGPGRPHPQATIFYKTYMPPTFLTHGGLHITREEGICTAGSTTHSCVEDDHYQAETILDLQGADTSVLLDVLSKWLPCSKGNTGRDASAAKQSEKFLHIVSPPSVILPLVEDQNESREAMAWEGYSIVLTRDHHGHISTEDLPAFDGSVKKFLNQLRLDLYSFSCVQ